MKISKKIGHFILLIGGFFFDFIALLFWFDLFLEAMGRNPGKEVILKLPDL